MRETILGLMPTGGGKSITFQVPALLMDGICIVVTPLIALMKDQVDNLKRIGIKANSIHSGMSRQEINTQLKTASLVNTNSVCFLPERFGYRRNLLAKLQAMKVSLLVIDESHCISQWGYDFRPSYLKIAGDPEAVARCPGTGSTATAAGK